MVSRRFIDGSFIIGFVFLLAAGVLIQDPAFNNNNGKVLKTNMINKSGATDQRDVYAVIAGVSNYPSSEYDLSYCDDDARDVASLIRDMAHIPEENIEVMMDHEATISEIKSSIQSYSSKMDENDVLFFYFSGHGSATQQITNTVSWHVESSHNYYNNMDSYWHYSYPGADLMRVHFTRVDTESGYDAVFIGDNNQREYMYDYFTGGPYYDVWSAWVPTDDIYVNLYSDYSITDWGFEVDQVQIGYWTSPYEIIPYDGLDNGITGSDLNSILDEVPGRVITVLDTCHSGGVGNSIQAQDRFIMTACQNDEFSLEDTSRHNGVFTYYFLNAWTQLSDINGDSAISFEETYNYISTNTESRSSALDLPHHPVKYDNIDGETILEPNAEIISCSVNAQGDINMDYYINGIGVGKSKVVYYDKVHQVYTVALADDAILPTDTLFQENINAPGSGFSTSAVAAVVSANYNGYRENSTYSIEIDGAPYSSVSDIDGDGCSDLEEFNCGSNPYSTDTDGDGMSDTIEFYYGLDPIFDDTEDDMDGDGIPNGWEVNFGLDPANVNNQYTDTDGDGLRDYLEWEWGANPLIWDSDGDGFNDYDEFRIGFDPGSAGNSPIAFLLVFVAGIAFVTTIVVYSKKCAAKTQFKRPRPTKERPTEKSKPIVNKSTTRFSSSNSYSNRSSYNTRAYGGSFSPSTSRSPNISPKSTDAEIFAALPIQIKWKINSLPIAERNIAKALIIARVREEMRKLQESNARELRFCTRCGVKWNGGPCYNCGYRGY